MMRKLIALFLSIAWLSGSLPAQNNYLSAAGDSDPKAKALLQKIRDKYEGYRSLEANFVLEIRLPDQPAEQQRGSLARQGDQYRMQLSSYEAISDGETIWLIMNSNKEVQINDVPEETDDFSILSPQALFAIYERGDFVYAITNEFKEGGRTLQQVEFKPLDEMSDYSKLRLTADKNSAEVMSVEAFAKDGSRYLLKMTETTPNKSFPAGYFTFDKSDYPGFYVEDLRE